MTGSFTDLGRLGARLVGGWTTRSTHPLVPGTVVLGGTTFEWLTGRQFIVARSWTDHPDFPDAISIIGDTDGLQLHWFDSRGVHRTYAVTVSDQGWEAIRHSPPSPSDFSQRLPLSFADDGNTMFGTTQISHDDATWEDDLVITYQRQADELAHWRTDRSSTRRRV